MTRRRLLMIGLVVVAVLIGYLLGTRSGSTYSGPAPTPVTVSKTLIPTGSPNPAALRAATPTEQYDRVFACLRGHGYVGFDENKGSWPRVLVMLRKTKNKDDLVGFTGKVFRSQKAAHRDAVGNADFLAEWTRTTGSSVSRSRATSAPSSGTGSQPATTWLPRLDAACSGRD